MDDVRAVMDAVGSKRAILLGFSEGSPMSVLFAATYPERVSHLILGGYANSWTDAPYRSGPSRTWVKTKNPASEAVRREGEEKWQ